MANPFLQDIYGGASEDERSPTSTTPVRPSAAPANPFVQDISPDAPAPAPASAAAPGPPQLNKPFGELKPSDESWTQWLKWKAMDALTAMGAKPHVARHLGGAGVDIASITPMGAILSAADLTHDVPRGNIVASAFDALGALPGVSAVTRAARHAPTGGVPQMIPAHVPPVRETRRGEPDLGGFVTPTERELQTTGRAGYRSIEQAPIVYHPSGMADATDWARNALPNPRFGPVFTPETAPNTHAMLERYTLNFPRGGPRAVNAYDFDGLRQQLLSQKGAEAAAGRQAADIIDTYMLNPPRGMVLQGENLLPELRETYGAARGNWRGFKTSSGVTDAIDAARIGAAGEHSGKNLGNRTRQSFQQYVKTPQGERKLFGATPQQLNAIEEVATGDRTTNVLRSTSNLLGGGGGMGQAVSGGISSGIGALVAPFVGLSPTTGAMVGGGTSVIGGKIARGAANARTARQAEEVATGIRQSTPLYRARRAATLPVDDLRGTYRDMIAMALMPTIRDEGKDAWNRAFTPYANR